MRDGSLLCIGKGNLEWNILLLMRRQNLSRKKAKEMLSLDDFKESMKDVYTTSVCKETIDEAPDAYKKDVETLIGDTVENI